MVFVEKSLNLKRIVGKYHGEIVRLLALTAQDHTGLESL